MLRQTLASIKALIKSKLSSSRKITCYHCGEKSPPKHTVYVSFDGEIRPVCCHGCATILRTVEDLGMLEEYLAHKIQPYQQDE